MATVFFIVKATIPKKKEAAFNRWYNYKHCPQFLRYPGAEFRAETLPTSRRREERRGEG
jgi:hypothetical protein